MEEKEILKKIETIEEKILQKLNELDKTFRQAKRQEAISSNLAFNNLFYQKLVIQAINICLGPDQYAILVENDEAILPSALAELRSDLLEEKGYIIPSFDVTPLDSLIDEQFMIFIRNEVVFKAKIDNTVLDRSKYITDQVYDMVFKHADKLVTREMVWNILKIIEETDRYIVEELKAKNISIGLIREVFVNLLTEKISIKDIRLIFQKMLEMKVVNPTGRTVSEYLRPFLIHSVLNDYIIEEKPMKVIRLSLALQNKLMEELSKKYEPDKLEIIARMIIDGYKNFSDDNLKLIVDPPLRHHVRRIVNKYELDATVLSTNEISDQIKILESGMIEFQNYYEINEIVLDGEVIEDPSDIDFDDFEELF